MGAERHDNQPDDFDESNTVADAYAPPAPGPEAGHSRFLLAVLGIVALCIVVFVVAVALR